MILYLPNIVTCDFFYNIRDLHIRKFHADLKSIVKILQGWNIFQNKFSFYNKWCNNKYSQFYIISIAVHLSFINNSNFSLIFFLSFTYQLISLGLFKPLVSLWQAFLLTQHKMFSLLGKQPSKERNTCIYSYLLLKIVSLKTSENCKMEFNFSKLGWKI